MRFDIREIAERLTNLFVGAVEGFLALRFVLKLFGASATNGFVDWVYDMSAVLLAPFRSIFPTEVFDSQYVLEFNTLFAMLVYALLGLVVLAIIHTVTAPQKGKR